MTTTDTTVSNLIINKLTQAQYEAITTPSDTELYLTTDSAINSTDVTTALGYTPQAELVSGTSIKTVNSNSLLGSGNISISDTKNTAGSSNASYKLYLVGAQNQSTNAITYSKSTVYANTDGTLNCVTPASTKNDTTVATTKWVKDLGYTTNTGTVTSVNNVSPVNGNITLSIPTVDQTYDATSANAQSGVAIAGAKFLKNNSSNTAGTSYIIGGTASGVSNAVCVGSSASTTAYSVVVGQGASSTALYSTAIGSTADSNSQFGTAIGYAAKARATSAIQLGTGTNTDTNTLSIGFSDAATNYQLLDGTTGLIPDARLSTNIQRTLVSGTSIKTINSTSLLGSGDISVLQNNYLPGTTGSLTILGQPCEGSYSISIGDLSKIEGEYVSNSLAIGALSSVKSTGMNLDGCIAIGSGAKVIDASEAVQIGNGTNTTSNTLQINTWTLLNTSTGLIPDARLSSSIARTSNVADTTLSNVSSIDSNSVVQTALDGKVSKSGDTMTGDLNISKTNPQFYLINTDMELGVTPSENYVSNLRFIDKNETNLGNCYLRQQSTGVTDINLNCINPSGGSAATLRVGFNANGDAYSTFPNTYRCDGQWIAESQTICSGRTAETSDKNWTLNLPNDSYDYEVLLVGAVTTGATSGNQARINLQSSIIQSNIVICNAQTRTTSTVTTYGACIIPVGSNHTVTVIGWGSNTGAYSLYLRGYRRIGTNS